MPNFVIAVSGGVDSIVLLDALAHERLQELTPNPQLPTPNSKLIVAHFDHGTREDSVTDGEFVRGVAENYGLPFESERMELGKGVSEAAARKARYNFLRQCCNKYGAPLMTAHHQDDLVETMVINLIRGTGWRGLAPMEKILELRSWTLDGENLKHNPGSVIPAQAGIQSDHSSETSQYSNHQPPTTNNQPLLRPLLDTPKATLLEYAKNHSLQWREDSTNTDTAYLRNYVRLELLPRMMQKDPAAKQKLLAIYKNTALVKKEIATELQKITFKYQISNIKYHVPRYVIIMFLRPVALELIYHILTNLDPDWHPNRLQIARALHFIKTGQPQKTLEVSGRLQIKLTTREVQFKRA